MKERKFTRGREYGMRVRLGRKRKRKKERGSQREGDRVDGGGQERGERKKIMETGGEKAFTAH